MTEVKKAVVAVVKKVPFFRKMQVTTLEATLTAVADKDPDRRAEAVKFLADSQCQDYPEEN